jgi:GrpB-like predicted nucleotidyltransferase (UPF0157 family)
MDIDEPVHIVSYDDQWPKLFEQEKERLKHTLNKQCLEFEHIGSTSVVGLSAKPIIDIMIGVESYPPPTELILKISALGYSFHGEANVPGRLYFTRRGQHNFNLAVVLLYKEHWIANIKFRNYLRHHPQERQEYERIKNAAVRSGAATLLPYSELKKEFIANILKKL